MTTSRRLLAFAAAVVCLLLAACASNVTPSPNPNAIVFVNPSVTPAPPPLPAPTNTVTLTPMPPPTTAPTPTAIPSTTLSLPTQLATTRDIVVPILMYHHLKTLNASSSLAARTWTVSPSNFAAQLDYLAAHDFHTITFARLLAYFDQDAPLPPRPIIITFDDDWAEQYDVAFKDLQQRGMIGTFFVPTAYADSTSACCVHWQQILEMDAAGMEVGGHTINHPNLEQISPVEVTRQLVTSKRAIEARLGHATVAFAYPFGAFNLDVIARVRAAGYRAAVILCCGYKQRADAMLTMPRIRISYDDTLTDFAKRLPP